MISWLIWNLLKFLIIAIILTGFYAFYKVYLVPYLFIKKYKKYKNVYVDEKVPVYMGDLYLYEEDSKKGIPYYIHAIKRAEKLKDYDMRVSTEGTYPKIRLFSPQALKEFIKLQPDKIDRDREDRGIGKLMSRSFLHIRSKSSFESRKRHFLNLLSINFASNYIPTMIKKCEEVTGKWKDGDVIEIFKEMNDLTFSIFTDMLYGEDVLHILKKHRPYINSKGEAEMLEFEAFFVKHIKDYVESYYSPMTGIFPFLNDYQLCNPYKRNAINTETIVNCLKEAVNTTKDENSVCKRLLKDFEEIQSKEGMVFDEIIDDLITFMIAGSETTSRATSSILFLLKKSQEFGNRQIWEKLQKEMRNYGFFDNKDINKLFTKEIIQQFDYLNYVIKEGLRCDNPSFDTFGYKTYDDVEICGVPLPKNTEIRLDIYTSHYNPNEWKQPHEFIPERFDPESEYFYKPETNSKDEDRKKKIRSQYSFVAFSQGVRICPGMSLAMLEMKVLLLYLLSKFEFTIDKELLQKEGVGFGVGSPIFNLGCYPIKMNATVKRI